VPLSALPVRDLGGQNDLNCDAGKSGFQLSIVIAPADPLLFRTGACKNCEAQAAFKFVGDCIRLLPALTFRFRAVERDRHRLLVECDRNLASLAAADLGASAHSGYRDEQCVQNS
jgi:hypothetical protein